MIAASLTPGHTGHRNNLGLPPPRSTLPSQPRWTNNDSCTSTCHKPYDALPLQISYHSLLRQTKKNICSTIEAAEPVTIPIMHCHCNRMLGPASRSQFLPNLEPVLGILGRFPIPVSNEVPSSKTSVETVQPPLTQTPTERTRGESTPHRFPFAAWYITRNNGQKGHPTPHPTEGSMHHTRHLPPTPLISFRSRGTTLPSLWLAFVIELLPPSHSLCFLNFIELWGSKFIGSTA